MHTRVRRCLIGVLMLVACGIAGPAVAAQANGYEFAYPELEPALRQIIAAKRGLA